MRTPSKRSIKFAVELLLLRQKSIAIRMDGNKNHARPHFHIDYGKEYHIASYAIDTGERLIGYLPTKYDNAIVAWAEENRKYLLELWYEMRLDEKLDSVLIKQIEQTELDL